MVPLKRQLVAAAPATLCVCRVYQKPAEIPGMLYYMRHFVILKKLRVRAHVYQIKSL